MKRYISGILAVCFNVQEIIKSNHRFHRFSQIKRLRFKNLCHLWFQVFVLFGFAISASSMSADEFLEKTKFTSKAVTKKGNPAEGKVFYAMFCTNCHGEKGDGNGPVSGAVKMDPKPKNHTDGKYMNERKGEDLFKTVKLGGKAVDKSVYMPAFGVILSGEDILDLIAFMRTLAVPPYSGN